MELIKMKCTYCPKSAVYYRKISNEYVCKEHFIKTIERKVIKTIRKYKMFTPGQKIVVGLSGGKDSLVLLFILQKFQRNLYNTPPMEAILIDEGIKGYRRESIEIAKKICKKWGIHLNIISFKEKFGSSLDFLIPKLHKIKINACTVCGTVRRRLLNEKALELKADKLAIGHNLDDQSETFLQNIVRNDLKRIAQHPPNGNIKDTQKHFVQRIKPLMLIPESEITLFCYYNEIPIQTTPCPYVEDFFILRKNVQEFLNKLEKRSPEIKYNLINANENLIELLNEKEKKKKKKKKLERQNKNLGDKDLLCEICSQPKGKNRKTCYYCELKKKLDLD